MPHNDEFADLVGDSPSTYEPSHLCNKTVKNVFPIITNTPYRLAIIGEAPGSDEISSGIPFFGASGRELNKILDHAKLLRDACFVGNICQHQPPGNKIANFDWNGVEIQSGLAQLKHDLHNFKPNLIWCLGGSSLHAFRCGSLDSPPKRKTKEGPQFVFPNSISDWRGSLFASHLDSPSPGTKAVASFHPAAALRNYEYIPLILLDACQKVRKESEFPELNLPQRRLLVNLSIDEILAELRKVKLEKPLISVDIEGGVGSLSCLSIASSATFSFIIPFTRMDGTSLWDLPDECLIWRHTCSVLSDPTIPKIFQNGLYDRFVLQFSYGITVRGCVEDTMLKSWELYPELPKGLGFLASIFTNEPYWKEERIQAEMKT